MNVKVFPNQGFRNAENVLPFVNYDMAESYVVSLNYSGKSFNVEGYGIEKIPETLFFPVSQDGKEDFYDTLYYLGLVDSLIKEYGGEDFRKFVFLNYAAPDFVFNKKKEKLCRQKPCDAIFLSFATVKLIHRTSFLEVSFDPYFEFSNVYFVNLAHALI